MNRRRVVITGLGAVTSLGLDAPTTFGAVLEGRSGVAPITSFDATDYTTRFAAQVKGFEPSSFMEAHEARKLDPFALFAMSACIEAMKDSGLQLDSEDRTRIGCIVGVGIGGLDDIETQHHTLIERGPRRVNPFFIPRIMMNAAAGQVSIRLGLQGPNYGTASACASSAHALGLAAQSIRLGEAEVMLAGGSEAAITPLGIAGFNALKALSTRNDSPETASRPFDRDRDGFVMGEGGGCLVLEELEHARARRARIYGEFLGFGMTADAHHITAPAPGGEGAARAIRLALRDGATAPEDVQYCNAHGTSTPINDPLETAALKSVFGDHAYRLAISSSKSMVGHLLGGSGAVEAVLTTLSIQRGVIHPTANLVNPDPECDLDYVPGAARELKVRRAISNSLGFGGHNACVLLGSFEG
jgi:3-oxoacyl-[acyl-carrier-protein] synthase II